MFNETLIASGVVVINLLKVNKKGRKAEDITKLQFIEVPLKSGKFIAAYMKSPSLESIKSIP